MQFLYLCAATVQHVDPQSFWDANKVMLTSIITWLVGLGGTWFARYHIPPSNWLLQAIRAVLGAVLDQIHPVEFKKLAASARGAQLQGSNEQKEQEAP